MDAADADAVRASSKKTARVGERFTILLTIIIVYAMLLSFQYKRGIANLSICNGIKVVIIFIVTFLVIRKILNTRHKK